MCGVHKPSSSLLKFIRARLSTMENKRAPLLFNIDSSKVGESRAYRRANDRARMLERGGGCAVYRTRPDAVKSETNVPLFS